MAVSSDTTWTTRVGTASYYGVATSCSAVLALYPMQDSLSEGLPCF